MDNVQSDTDRNNDSKLCFQSPSLARVLQTGQGDSCKTSVRKSVSPIFKSKKIGEIIKTPEPNRRSLTNNASFITLNVVYATIWNNNNPLFVHGALYLKKLKVLQHYKKESSRKLHHKLKIISKLKS